MEGNEDVVKSFLLEHAAEVAVYLAKRRIGVSHVGPQAPWSEDQLIEMASAWLNAAATGQAPEKPPELKPPAPRSTAPVDDAVIEHRLECLRLAEEYSDIMAPDAIVPLANQFYDWVTTGKVPEDSDGE